MVWPWSRRTAPAANRELGCLGIDFNASRVRAAMGRAFRNRLVPLDEPHADLPLPISCEELAAKVGRVGVSVIRRLPHVSCAGYLAFLGQPRDWNCGRHRLTAANALSLVFEELRMRCGEFETIYLGLPSYLSPSQASKVNALAVKHRCPVKGTVISALAVAADRAAALLGHPSSQEGRVEGIVPMYRTGKLPLPADVIVVDADDHALTGCLIRIEADHVALSASTSLTRVGAKLWKDRLLDALADRCVRACRRDPRDSAEAEQFLYEQIDNSLDELHNGQAVTLTVRGSHWYQDLRIRRDDYEADCASLIRASVESIRELHDSASTSEPPRAVWLTHEAGRLPGLAKAIFQNMSERTSVGVMRAEATSIAVANLGERWPDERHVDRAVPIKIKPPAEPPQTPAAQTQR